MGLLDKLNNKLAGKNDNPVAQIINTEKHNSGRQHLSFDIPVEEDELTEEQKEALRNTSGPYVKSQEEIEQEIKGELGINTPATDTDDGQIFKINKDKEVYFTKQSEKIVNIYDRVQTLICELIADVEEFEGFKLTPAEKEDIMLFLPDIAEEKGWKVSNELGLALAMILITLKRIKMAWRMRKAAKEEKLKLAA